MKQPRCHPFISREDHFCLPMDPVAVNRANSAIRSWNLQDCSGTAGAKYATQEGINRVMRSPWYHGALQPSVAVNVTIGQSVRKSRIARGGSNRYLAAYTRTSMG